MERLSLIETHRDQAGSEPRPGFFLYPESRPRHFLTFLGFFCAWVFPGLQTQDSAQVFQKSRSQETHTLGKSLS